MAQPAVNKQEKTGLVYWMNRVLEEQSKLSGNWAPEAVHDLRVALRRCILIADLMRDLDPGAGWKPMRKAGRRLFRKLGTLRDTEVLAEWVQRLDPPEEASTAALLGELKAKYERDRAAAQGAAKEFDRKQWRAWSRELAGRFRHVASDKSACEALTLELWEAVRDSHRLAQKHRSGVAYHRARVELKKFRYAVQNFLPSMYTEWAPDLKFLQDLLGEIHDLDVLSQVIRKFYRTANSGGSKARLAFGGVRTNEKAFSGETARVFWASKLQSERASRLQQYRAKMAGNGSPLWTWREGLPGGKELRPAGLARLAVWAYFVTPSFPRVRRIARLALQLYDGFTNCGLIGTDSNMEERFILHAAAVLQEVGHFKKNKAHHKESYRMIRGTTPPVGWTKTDLELVAVIARFHRRALPSLDHRVMRTYQLPLRHSLLLLAGLLRMANAFGAKPYHAVRSLEVENCAGVIVLRAEGYRETDPLTPKLSEAKRLLEFASNRPVHILTPGAQIAAPRLVQPVTQSDAA